MISKGFKIMLFKVMMTFAYKETQNRVIFGQVLHKVTTTLWEAA